MASTKLIRQITTPINNRLVTAEGHVSALQARVLLDSGADITLLNNNANYQTYAQVDARIEDVVGLAPAALDTLEEIAEKLGDNDDAVAALVAVDATQAGKIYILETDYQTLENNQGNLSNIIAGIQAEVTAFAAVQAGLAAVEQRLSIRRFTLTADLSLDISDAACQNLINQSGATRAATLPTTPSVGINFQVINHSSSDQSISFAGEIIAPGDRHAVQWDGVEWVVL